MKNLIRLGVAAMALCVLLSAGCGTRKEEIRDLRDVAGSAEDDLPNMGNTEAK